MRQVGYTHTRKPEGSLGNSLLGNGKCELKEAGKRLPQYIAPSEISCSLKALVKEHSRPKQRVGGGGGQNSIDNLGTRGGRISRAEVVGSELEHGYKRETSYR